VSPTKAAEPIKMPVGGKTPRNQVLDGEEKGKGQFFGVEKHFE